MVCIHVYRRRVLYVLPPPSRTSPTTLSYSAPRVNKSPWYLELICKSLCSEQHYTDQVSERVVFFPFLSSATPTNLLYIYMLLSYSLFGYLSHSGFSYLPHPMNCLLHCPPLNPLYHSLL